MNTTSKIGAVSGQKRFQGTTQACPAVGMVPHTSEGVYGRHMVSTDHMQKARVRKFHTVAYGGHTVSTVSWSAALNRCHRRSFSSYKFQLWNHSEKLLGFGALFFDLPEVEMSVYTSTGGP